MGTAAPWSIRARIVSVVFPWQQIGGKFELQGCGVRVEKTLRPEVNDLEQMIQDEPQFNQKFKLGPGLAGNCHLEELAATLVQQLGVGDLGKLPDDPRTVFAISRFLTRHVESGEFSAKRATNLKD